MFRHDGNFWWRPGHLYLPAERFKGDTTGSEFLERINSLDYVGMRMDTNGDEVGTILAVPEIWDVDPEKEIEWRVHWTSGSSTTDDTVTWKVTHKEINREDTAIAVASTALTNAVAQDTVSGAYDWQVTEWGTLKGRVLTKNAYALPLGVEMDAKAAGLTEALLFLGLELRYTPRYLTGPSGMRSLAKEGRTIWHRSPTQ